MPKKKNFLGGMQNYDPNNGQYEPDLTNKQGEPVKNFKSFSKDKDESFDAINKKRMGKETPKENGSSEKVKYFKHPEVDGVWHDTGETTEKYGKSYKLYENEQGKKWAVSDEFSKQFKPFDKDKKTELLSKEYLDKFYELSGGDENKMLDLIRKDPAYQNNDNGDPNDTWSMGDLEGVVSAYFEKKGKDFDTTNKKRMYGDNDAFNKSYDKYKSMGHNSDDARMLANRESRDNSEDERLNAIIEERIKRGYDQRGTYDPTAIQDLGYLGFGSLDALEEHTFGKKTTIEEINDKRMGREPKKENKFEDLIDEDYKPTDAGKIIQYKPYIRKADGSWGREEGNTRRAKTLNNGLAMETKAYDKEHIYHEQVGKYKLVDLETGTMVGWAKDYDDAMAKSNNEDFIAAIKRAKEVHKRVHKED